MKKTFRKKGKSYEINFHTLCAAGRAARTGPDQHDALPWHVGPGLSVWCACTVVWQLAGRTVAAIHLLGVHLAVRLLSAAGPPPGQMRRGGVWVRRTCHGGHADLHACGCCLVRRVDPAGLGYDHHRTAGKVDGKGAPGGRPCREHVSVLLHPLCSRWLFAAGPLAHHTAGFSLRQLLHGLSGVLSRWLLLYGLLPTDPVALPVLGWFLPASSGRANSAESPSAASFGLPTAGVAGAELADAISAPPAGDLRRADGGVPVAAPGWRSALKNSAKGS